MKKLALNITLIFISLLFSIFLIEISLRIFYPKYKYAAESKLQKNNTRIWSRTPNTQGTLKHSDTGISHAVIHNNLALRQHRNFTKEDLKTSNNIGFFGDSFTENTRIPAQYSFTEPLDYLLNLSGKKFNVLNFGVDGYGADQCYLYYKELDCAKELDYVFYVFCVNDLRNIHINNIFTVDKSGMLIMNSHDKTPFWIKIISKLHITYLSLDILKKLFPNSFDLNDQDIKTYFKEAEFEKRQRLQRSKEAMENFDKALVKENLTVFMSIIRSWQELVRKNGGKFYIVLLPRHWENLIFNLVKEDFKVLSLFQTFSNTIANYKYSDYKLNNDIHWNEKANLLAAVHIYQFLQTEIDFSGLSSEAIEKALYAYYSALSNGWMPDTFLKSVSVSSENLSSIKNKYIALELNSVHPEMR